MGCQGCSFLNAPRYITSFEGDGIGPSDRRSFERRACPALSRSPDVMRRSTYLKDGPSVLCMSLFLHRNNYLSLVIEVIFASWVRRPLRGERLDQHFSGDIIQARQQCLKVKGVQSFSSAWGLWSFLRHFLSLAKGIGFPHVLWS